MSVEDVDRRAVHAQLDREPRDLHSVAHRCGCGLPDVVTTAPRLDDGTPFPTFYYLTCPKLNRAMSRLESAGVMAQMNDALRTDVDLADAHRAAHQDFLDRRGAVGDVPEIAGTSAGGMPDRVKCLHSLAAHALAAGPGVNWLGERALAMAAQADPEVADRDTPCVCLQEIDA